MSPRDLLRRFDRLQRQRSAFAFALAVQLKYSEDSGSYLAAIVTYYAFLSLFPLLLVATTVLGFVIRGHPTLQRIVSNSVLGTFPIIGHDLKLHALTGNSVALVAGLTLSLWAGIRVFVAAGSVMDQIWGIPPRRRPGFLRARLRAVSLAFLLGVGAVGTSALNALGTVDASQGLPSRIGWHALSTLGNVALFWVGFHLLTTADVAWRDLRGGAVFAALAWDVLQAGGGLYVHYVVTSASNTYGTFASVIGLLSFIYLSVRIGLLAAEGNVVATRQLWPRSLPIAAGEPATDGDRRALELREASVGERFASAAAFPQEVSKPADSGSRSARQKSNAPTTTRRSSMDSILDRAKQEVGSEFTRLRWAVGLNGALSIAVGVVILIWPGISLFALTILFGAYMAASGAVGLGAAFHRMTGMQRAWLVLSSILGVAAGIAVLVWPNIGALALLYIIGAYAITFGIVMAGGAFWLPINQGDKAVLLFSGFVSILFGIVMFAKPGDGAIVLLALIAAFALVIGVGEVVVAIGGKRLLEARVKNMLKSYEPKPKQKPKPQPSS